MALNVNIIGKDSEGNLQALKVNSEGNLDFGQLETEIQLIKDNQGRLYGKYGEAWIPVKVDNEGRPIIASDVTVNAEGMVVDLGQIKQGPAGTEPWPVQLSGTSVLETVVNAATVPPEGWYDVTIQTEGASKIFLLVNSSQLWNLQVGRPWSASARTSALLYPNRTEQRAFSTINNPCITFLMGLPIDESFGLQAPSTMAEAQQWGLYLPSYRIWFGNASDENATYTLRVVKTWSK